VLCLYKYGWCVKGGSECVGWSRYMNRLVCERWWGVCCMVEVYK